MRHFSRGRRTSCSRIARIKFKLTWCTAVQLVALTFFILWAAVELLPSIPTAVDSRLSKLPFLMPGALGENLEPSSAVLTTTTAKPEEVELVGWERGKSRDPVDYIQPFKDTSVISGRAICGNPSTYLVVICTSRPDGFSNRAAVRDTWASVKLRNVKVGFLVGFTEDPNLQLLIEEESQQFQDVIQENFVDTYTNLTLKSIFLLKWYIRWCRESLFLMKADDDTLVDLTMLVRRLDDYPPVGTLFGFLYNSSEVIRDVNDKWYVPKYMYPNKTYMPYIDGSAYVMSRDVAVKLYYTALETPIFHLEDVYLTGICAQKSNVKLQHFKWSKKFWRSFYNTITHLLCLRRHVTCHPLYPWQMRVVWKVRNSPTTQPKTTIYPRISDMEI